MSVEVSGLDKIQTHFVALIVEFLRAYDVEMSLCISERTRTGSIAQTLWPLSQEYLSGQHIRK